MTSNLFQDRFYTNPFLRITWVQHVLFWTLYFGFNFLRWGFYFSDFSYSLRSNMVEFPIHILLAYLNLYYLLPKYIPKKPWVYVFSLAAAVLMMSLLRILLNYWLVTEVVWRESSREESLFGFNYILAVFTGELYVVGVTTAIKLTLDYVTNQKRTQELEKKNLENELAFLKSQMQPHFFFNTLNNLYSLTLDKSDLAPQTVLKLSELMKYVIYETKKKWVPLTTEVNQVYNYLDLEKLRYGKRLEIDFEISGEIDGRKIPPMLFLPFIENSFKHGTDGLIGTIPIHISLHVNEDVLYFTVENKKPVEERLASVKKDKPSGVGISNTRRRLNLLYGNKANLDIFDGEDENFRIELKLPVE